MGIVLEYVFNWIGEPYLYDSIPRRLISDFGPSVIYMMIGVLLWMFTGKLTRILVPNEELQYEVNTVAILQVGIGLVGIYSIVLDFSGILWSIRDFFAVQLGLFHEERGFGIMMDMVVHVLNVAISLFLIFKAGWISRKLHTIWSKPISKIDNNRD
ncbi:hypothetical protein [Paenibacillus soyae]|uniref:Uncharacterized protein n=1 Tax=Paenibacillus soyae TaxID=2969249 RepID=A0A9X2SCB7_9BACL|nr:hypothetical protein [Paenibacillus soyae]MCR2805852.1 hypothetical protein [Paenibacillus soyae]